MWQGICIYVSRVLSASLHSAKVLWTQAADSNQQPYTAVNSTCERQAWQDVHMGAIMLKV